MCTQAGADGIQYREKRMLSFSDRAKVAKEIQLVCSKYNSTLIVNDFVDVAVEISAPAIHLGAQDEAIESARRKLSQETLIGGTANSIDEALVVAAKDVDYLGVGPVFGTTSKASPAEPLGLDNLKQICDLVDKPVVAIGNIQLENVVDVLEAGAHGVAVISAIVCAPDVAQATRRFCDLLGLP